MHKSAPLVCLTIFAAVLCGCAGNSAKRRPPPSTACIRPDLPDPAPSLMQAPDYENTLRRQLLEPEPAPTRRSAPSRPSR